MHTQFRHVMYAYSSSKQKIQKKSTIWWNFICIQNKLILFVAPCISYIFSEVLKISLKTHLKPLIDKRYAYKNLSRTLVQKL